MKTQTERGIRFDISCEVCRDLMPLVRDGVASADSEALVRVHTERCGGCRTMLESETPPEHSMPDDARVLRRLRWRLLAQSVLFALVVKTFATGARSEDLLGSYICAGIGGALMAQIAVNVGMNLRLLPVIGVTLPFYSAGGSSVLMLYICVGLVLSVYSHNTKSLFG